MADRCVESDALPGATRMQCFKGDFNNVMETFDVGAEGAEYRCGCWRLYPLDGETCDTFVDDASGWFSVIFMMSMVVGSLYIAQVNGEEQSDERFEAASRAIIEERSDD